MPRTGVALVLAPLLTTFVLLAHGPSLLAAQAGERMLTAGESAAGEIGGGETHSYRVALAAGEFFHARVIERGVDVAVKVFGPGGQYLFTADGWYSSGEPDRVSLLAEAAGVYRLEVSALNKDARRGRYELKVEELRPAVPRDRELVAAERVLDEGLELAFGQGPPEPTRAAAERLKGTLELWRRIGDRRTEAYTLLLASSIYNRIESYEQALVDAAAALDLYRSFDARPGQFRALQMLAYAYTFTSNNHKAVETLADALSLCPLVANDDEEGRACEANVRFNTGYNLLVLGDYQEALRQYERVLPLTQRLGWTYLEGMTLHHYGWVYAELGEYAKALDYLTRSLPLLRPGAKNHYGYAYALNNAAFAYRATGESGKALELLGEALEHMRALGNRRGEAFTLDSLGFTYASLGERGKALEHYRLALPLWRAAGDRDGEANTLAGIARVERDGGDLPEARRQIEAALAIVESIRGRVSREGLRSTYFATKRHYYEFYIDTLMRLHGLDPTRGYAAAALLASERARARGLLESLAEAGADIRRGVDPALLESERAAQRRLNAAAARLSSSPADLGPDAREAAKSELDAALAEHARVQERIRAESPAYAALVHPEPVGLVEIQSAVLDAGTLLLEYALGEERSYLFAVTPTSFKTYELPPRAEVEAAAREVYELLTARNRRAQGEAPEAWRRRVAEADRDYARAAERLSRVLLAPAAAELGDKRLLVVAEGALQYVPFAALPEPKSLETGQGDSHHSSSASDSGLVPLVAGHEVVILPSASTVALLRSESRARTAGKASGAVAVVADPVFDADDPRLGRAHTPPREPATRPSVLRDVMRAADEAGVRLERLRAAGDEAERIAALAPKGQVLKAVGLAANKARASGPELSRYRILHFATHALVNSQHPELSGIVLSLVDEAGRPQDGFFRLHEIYNLAPRLGADLVVLSACQTALGREIKGEGLVGLTRGFMYAGAPRVVASLWRVDDQATAELMGLFYEGMLKRGLPAARALKEAQVRMAARRPSPYYWAAFTLQGEWRP